MIEKDFCHQVGAAFRRLETLEQGNFPAQELTSKLMAELSSALQELQAAAGEVLTQNEELISSRRELEEERRRYQELFEFAPDGYLVTDTEGIILDANSAATGLFNIRKPFLVGKPLAMFVHSQERHLFRTLLARLKKEAGGLSGDWRFLMFSMQRAAFPASLTVASATVREKTVELRWLLRDITERRQMEEELQKEGKLESLGILAGGIAHDLNNLLTVILGNLSLAKRYANNNDRIYKRLLEMDNAITQTRSLTVQLLTFAKGGKPLAKAVSIRGLIEEASSFALSGSNVSCQFIFPEDLPPVKIDRGQITQVISNLLINADQAMEEGGTIIISAENLAVSEEGGILPILPGNYVAITIKDDGAGIPQQNLAKIFDPYFSTKEKGSGLGLTICYSIIKKHGGHIFVKSAAGEGTSFTVFLPVSNDKVEESDYNDDSLLSGEGKVLFMDDVESVRQTAGEMLTFLGYDVEFAKNGSEAAGLYKEALCSEHPFDVVICDLTIRGGMGGKKAVRELLKIDPGAKVIASSGYSNDAILNEFEKHGFCGVVAKPYRIQELGEVMSRVIRGREQ